MQSLSDLPVYPRIRRKAASLKYRLPSKPPASSVAAYIMAAPSTGQPHLVKLYGILKKVAPDAIEVLDYGTPYFTEHRFLFAFSAFQNELVFSPTDEGLKPFRNDLKRYEVKHGGLSLSYSKPLPAELVRVIAAHRVEQIKSIKTGPKYW